MTGPVWLQHAATAVRLRTSIRRYAYRVLDALGHPPVASDPGEREFVRTTAFGPAPLRVLVFGAGLAIGYGATTRDAALDGALVRLLADRTGRGVVLENRARQHLRLSEAVESLGAVGTHTWDVAIWCPSFADGLERLRLTSWRNQLHTMIREIRAAEPTPILLTHMAVPAGWHPAAVVARPWVLRINRVIDQVAAEHDAVLAVGVEPFTPREVGQLTTGPAYFAASAARVDEGLVRLLTAPAAARR